MFSKNSIIYNDLESFDRNLIYKKLDQRYLNKLSMLLSYNDKKYVQKRNNINELEYKIDENNHICLTNSFNSYQNNDKENKKKCLFQNIKLFKLNNIKYKKNQDLNQGYNSNEIQSKESYNNNLSYDEYNYLNKSPIENEEEKKIIFSLKKKNCIKNKSHSQNNFHIFNMENSSQLNKNSLSNTILNENSLCKTTRKNYNNDDKNSFKNISMIDNVHNLSERYKLIKEYKNKIKRMDIINLFSYNKTKFKNYDNKNCIFKFSNIKMNKYQSKSGFLPNVFLKYDNSIKHHKKNLSLDVNNKKIINNKNKNKILFEESKEKMMRKEEIFEKIKLDSKKLVKLVKNIKKLINEKIIKKEDNINNKKNIINNKFFQKSFSLKSKK